MKGIVNKVQHAHTIIVGVNKLIEMKAIKVLSPDRIELFDELMGSDPKKRESYMKNLFTYARLKLKLHPDYTLTVADIETTLPIAKVTRGKVKWE